MSHVDFKQAFHALTGNRPFPWQERNYQEAISFGKFPHECYALPTSMGKTSIVIAWMLALAEQVMCNNRRISLRLTYVVNRRTIIDQCTDEVMRMRAALLDDPRVRNVRDALSSIGAGIIPVIGVSTLRGCRADNREWVTDPSAPSIIVATPDMVGSAVLFSKYGVGFKTKPMHAGIIGQDNLFLHDEAHIEPAFHDLLESVKSEQKGANDPFPIDVIALSATSRTGGSTFTLNEDDYAHPTIRKRLYAIKLLSLHPCRGFKRLPSLMAKQALRYDKRGKKVVVYADALSQAVEIASMLPKERTLLLTGTQRGHERDKMGENPIYKAFLSSEKLEGPTLYLVSTSAGELGANFSGNHLVCDMVSLERLIQRFGRVNRFGEFDDSEVHIFYDQKDCEGVDPLAMTIKIMSELEARGESVNPAVLESIPLQTRMLAYSNPSVTVPIDDVVFDALSMTTLSADRKREIDVSKYIHGVNPLDPPRTYLAWRKEVGWLGDGLMECKPSDILDDYPLKPHELLSDVSYRVFETIGKVLETLPEDQDAHAWLLCQSSVKMMTVRGIIALGKEGIENKTIVLEPKFCCIDRSGVMCQDLGSPPDIIDVADEVVDEKGPLRLRTTGDEKAPAGMELVMSYYVTDRRGRESDDDPVMSRRRWYVRDERRLAPSSRRAALLDVHEEEVKRLLSSIASRMGLPEIVVKTLVMSGMLHDEGKRPEFWQLSIGNEDLKEILARPSGEVPEWSRRVLYPNYRHEFGSMMAALGNAQDLGKECDIDLLLHLIVSSHGRGRPHVPPKELFDPRHEDLSPEVGAEVMRRFAKLQRSYGRWGLALIEAIFKAADYLSSSGETGTPGARHEN